MGSSASTEYCAFTKAVEHLGDRWSFLIVRELEMFGAQGFNTLAAGLPGRISRSVLAAKLRKLEELGLVARVPSSSPRSAPYALTPAGQQLVPTLHSLWQWARKWVPEDPTMAQRDPSVIVRWLTRRVDPQQVPERQVAIEVRLPDADEGRFWILCARAVQATVCLEDPLLGQDRYVYLEADAAGLLPVARGERPWADALADASVQLYGDPDLVESLPTWFLPATG